MNPSPELQNRWLHRFAVLTALATFCLIWVGGLVTSKGVGMAVPDWPTTYGYNMFLFPISMWNGGILYEHSHRLLASLVGFLTVVLAVWLWLKEPRRWVRNLGVIAVILVIGQGVLGGLRVTAMKDELGIFHATLAQLFFVLMGGLALFTSRWWKSNRPAEGAPLEDVRPFQHLAGAVAILFLTQLVIGATMRHQHAGLAIPDFPAAYGAWWPATDPESIARYNQARGEVNALNHITAAQINLQMIHRIMAVFIVAGVGLLGWSARQRFSRRSLPVRFALTLIGLVVVQAFLGAATIWSNKAADVATAHVAVGALSFLTTSLLILAAGRTLPSVRPVTGPSADPALDNFRERIARA
ncbi:MAG TPA: COX15/CtaA family protein [Verrucomicrobiae bacterium]|nr:COX15/CtaA family protein [Verrucomicrobiae bacterium]